MVVLEKRAVEAVWVEIRRDQVPEVTAFALNADIELLISGEPRVFRQIARNVAQRWRRGNCGKDRPYWTIVKMFF